jgi:hypothetical protein
MKEKTVNQIYLHICFIKPARTVGKRLQLNKRRSQMDRNCAKYFPDFTYKVTQFLQVPVTIKIRKNYNTLNDLKVHRRKVFLYQNVILWLRDTWDLSAFLEGQNLWQTWQRKPAVFTCFASTWF